jgi:transcriptional regulator with XRE-family HTH domain
VSEESRLGKRIEQYRMKAKLSQRALAKQIGKASSYISLIESGSKIPSLGAAYRIADVLHIPLWSLFTEDMEGIPSEWRRLMENPSAQRLISTIAHLGEGDIDLLAELAARLLKKD